MERITFLIAYMMTCCIQSNPIDNGFSVKVKPLTANQDLKPKNVGTVFEKGSQELLLNDEQNIWDVLNRLFYSHTKEPGPEVTKKPNGNKVTDPWPYNNMHYLNLPVISQPYDDYKIYVATAPPNVDLGSGAEKKKVIVYVVFPDHASEGDNNIEDIPKIYFVKTNSVKRKFRKKEEVDPILIIDSNRTVTGLKSKEVPKFVRFRNKLSNLFHYNTTR